eukprot:1144326-Pelagomonas_calceolata.AAC.2
MLLDSCWSATWCSGAVCWQAQGHTHTRTHTYMHACTLEQACTHVHASPIFRIACNATPCLIAYALQVYIAVPGLWMFKWTLAAVFQTAKKLLRQRKFSLHQLRKERHVGSKSRESPSPEDERRVNVDQVGFWPYRHRWGGRWKSPNIWMRGNCGGHQKEFHWGQSSNSVLHYLVGNECHSPRKRPFALGWRVLIFVGHCECGVGANGLWPFSETLSSLLVREPFLNARGLLIGVDFSFLFHMVLRARSPISSGFTKLVGGGHMLCVGQVLWFCGPHSIWNTL